MEPISRVPELNEHKLSRRTVVAGIAWSVPVIAVATATPAYAASGPGPVTVLPTTYSKSGAALTQAAYTGFLPTGSAANHASSSYLTGSPVADSFTSGSDTNGSAATVTALYTFNAVKGAKYSISLKVLTQYGTYNNSTSYSERQSLVATVVQGGASTSLAKVTVSHTNPCTRSNSQMAGYTLQTPAQGTKSYSITYTATATGAATVQCVFTLDARYSSLLRRNYVNDDMWISAPVVTRIS